MNRDGGEMKINATQIVILQNDFLPEYCSEYIVTLYR